jgi:hypothetical protein
MSKDLYLGLGIGLLSVLVLSYLNQIPFIGRFAIWIYIVVGIILIVKGLMK